MDERAEWLRATGAEIESGPQEYVYSLGYYAVFFYDPDGIKLEIVHVPDTQPERSTMETARHAERSRAGRTCRRTSPACRSPATRSS